MKKILLSLVLLVALLIVSCSAVKKQARYTFLYADKDGTIHYMDNATFNEVQSIRYGKQYTSFRN